MRNFIKPITFFFFLLNLLFFTGFTVGESIDPLLTQTGVRAQNGDAGAQLALGMIYTYGLEFPRLEPLAEYWLTRAGDEGKRASAYRILGDLKRLQNKETPTQGLKLAMPLYQKAAENGDPIAQFFYGRLITYDPANKDSKTVIEWLAAAGDGGYAPAYTELGNFYDQKGDYTKAYELYQKGEQGGDAGASFALASLYYLGHGVSKDAALAYKQIKKAAREGLPIAQFNLAKALKDGLFGEVDYEAAEDWLLLADKGGLKAARFVLEEHKKKCLSGDQYADDKWAESCFFARTNNDPVIWHKLGEIYNNELIPSGDHVMAAQRWYQRALCAGHFESYAPLLELLDVEQDYARAYAFTKFTRRLALRKERVATKMEIIQAQEIAIMPYLSLWERMGSGYGSLSICKR